MLYSGAKFVPVTYDTSAEYLSSPGRAASAGASTLVSQASVFIQSCAHLHVRLLVLVLAQTPSLLCQVQQDEFLACAFDKSAF